MQNPYSLKYQLLRSPIRSIVFFILCLFCQQVLAAQYAIVTAERAIIFSDQEMTSPLGYVVKGKKVQVGEVPRYKAQVSPIIVSGRVAYVRIKDISTEKERADSTELVAERFLKMTEVMNQNRVAVSYLSFGGQISNSSNNGSIFDKDTLSWNGVSLRGDALVSSHWDISVIASYLTTSMGDESYQMVEIGGGVDLRIIELSRFILRWDNQLLLVPYSSYNLRGLFKVNGYGGTAGTGFNLSVRLFENLGIEAAGGFYYTSLTGFKAPSTYNSPRPSFVGTRLSIGLNYHY